MKIRIILLAVLITGSFIHADDKYTKAMEKNLLMIDTASSVPSFLQISNNFERIALAEKDKWLPNYYAAYCLIIASFIDSSAEKKDGYIDKAEKFINIADSLQPSDSEIYTLKGLLALGRMVVNPMERWQKYGTLYNELFQKAKELNPNNPRPEYLIGQSIYNTPEQFGGGKNAALPILNASLEKYNKFTPETTISPDWGKEQVEQMLQSIEEK